MGQTLRNVTDHGTAGRQGNLIITDFTEAPGVTIGPGISRQVFLGVQE